MSNLGVHALCTFVAVHFANRRSILVLHVHNGIIYACQLLLVGKSKCIKRIHHKIIYVGIEAHELQGHVTQRNCNPLSQSKA